MSTTTDETPAQEIQINVKGPSELKLQITITTDKSVLELKQAIADKSEVEADRQRLIYSGRVLKDEDTLSIYKIQAGHTIHMVKGAARSGPSTATSSSPAASTGTQPLPTMQTGQNPHDPLTQLNSHLGFGAMAGLNPFADLGLNQNDPNMLQTMMSSPEFLQQMSTMMTNPAVMEQIIASNPQLASMAPQVRETFQSPYFREMISNPARLQQMLRMASMLRGDAASSGGAPDPFASLGLGGLGGAANSFPAPGTPGSTANSTATSTTTPASGPNANAAQDPFGLFSALGAGGAAGGAAGAGGLPAFDPALMQQLMYGGGGAFGNPMNAFGLGGAAGATPGAVGAAGAGAAVTQSPEERFQVQLQQLQDMGFTNAAQNVRALLATGGNVHSAIEYILGGGGL